MRLLARQAGWQDVLPRLYVLEAAPAAGSPPPFPPEPPASPEPASPTKPPAAAPEPPDPSDVFLPSEAPCPDPDAFYHALPPFCPPVDLGLERSSVDSGQIAGGGGGGGSGSSGTLTPASQPGTPSPLDGPHPFPAAAPGRHSSSLSNVLEDGSLPEPAISGDDTSNTSNPQVRRPLSVTGWHSGGGAPLGSGQAGSLATGVAPPGIRGAAPCGVPA